MCYGEPVKLEVTERCVATGFYNNDKPIQPGKDHLHDGVILLLRPEFTAMLFYYENYGYCCFVPIEIT